MKTFAAIAVFVLAAGLPSPDAYAQAKASAPAAPQPAPQPAQRPAAEWEARTGDAWVDRQLADINQYAARYRGAFLDELVRYHAAPRELVTELVMKRGWAPGDVYYACAVAQLVGKPCRAAVEAWQQGQADGWRAVAKQFGLGAQQPDASARMRQNIRDSFVRWGRPLAKPEAGKTAAKDKAAKDKRR
ncbi:hypothetical protein [Luteimonas aquatica]|uniref:hypothetical protein n=1 Tax=Luteimonas aquatica TaxID=450364 RepID=UPI001F596C53|nr:hypothetical protein [Luteimonas aquatica]